VLQGRGQAPTLAPALGHGVTFAPEFALFPALALGLVLVQVLTLNLSVAVIVA
jgi:hypothetical protein